MEAKGVAIGTIIGSSMIPQADMTRDGDEQCQRLACINHEEKANRLLSSSANMFEQFEQSGHLTDLSTAISFMRKGRALLPSHHSKWLLVSHVLADALSSQFNQSGERKDLDEAI